MVKYKDFIKHLKVNGCTLLRQGNKHEIWEKDGKQSSVPRHPNINKLSVRINIIKIFIFSL